jgi:WD40 repeat protein
LLATAHAKSVTVFSLSTLSAHSSLTGGHTRSVRCAAWKPGLPPHRLCLVTGSFDSTAGVWRWEDDEGDKADEDGGIEVDVNAASRQRRRLTNEDEDEDEQGKETKDWEFTLVLEGHDSEIKSCAFSPSGAHLATCSRDKSVWIWEDIGPSEADDEWETIAVLSEHEGDVKALAWCPDVPGRRRRDGRVYGTDCLASASYDNTARIWREDADAEWVCVAVLEGHEGTVWGVQWEAKPRDGDRFPRLLTHSADGSLRIWTLNQDAELADKDGGETDDHADGGGFGGGGLIPNTMRRSLREEWTCTATLPSAHKRDVYSAAWNPSSGLVASVCSDGTLGLYAEDATADPSTSWRLLTSIPNAHGPYEVNHVAWARRYDAAAGPEKRGIEDMLVTTGDDGVVRLWEVVLE